MAPGTGSTGAGDSPGSAGKDVGAVVTAGPSSLAGVAQLLAAAGLAVAAATGAIDRPGLLLALPVLVGLLAAGVRDLVLRPVVRADADGLTVVHGVRHVWTPWSGVERLSVVTERRSPLLEVDLGDALLVLSRRRLGRTPEAVLVDLLAVRPPG